MALLITKDCEIKNCVFNKGEIVADQEVGFYPTVMEKTDKAPTISVALVGDNYSKTEITKAAAKNEKTKTETPQNKKVVKETLPDTVGA